MKKCKRMPVKIHTHLEAEEELRWYGHPDPKRIFTAMDVILIPFSVIWCAGVYYGIGGISASMGFKGLLLSAMSPFFWMAIWLIPGRFIYQYYKRRKTIYAVTDKRLLIINTLFRVRCKSYNINDLPELEIHSVKKDATGTIKVSGIAPPMFRHHPKSTITTDFFDIPDVREVYHLIKNLRASLRTKQKLS